VNSGAETLAVSSVAAVGSKRSRRASSALEREGGGAAAEGARGKACDSDAAGAATRGRGGGGTRRIKLTDEERRARRRLANRESGGCLAQWLGFAPVSRAGAFFRGSGGRECVARLACPHINAAIVRSARITSAPPLPVTAPRTNPPTTHHLPDPLDPPPTNTQRAACA